MSFRCATKFRLPCKTLMKSKRNLCGSTSALHMYHNRMSRTSCRVICPTLHASFSNKTEPSKEIIRETIDQETSIITVEGEELVITNKFNPNHKIFRHADGSIMIRCAFGDIHRYGKNDSVITLCVGGKDFQTLTSTIATCEKLVDICMKSRMNSDICEDNGKTIFIDRDPEVFGYLVTYLRNKVEGLSVHSTAIQKLHNKTTYVKLPNDTTKLRELYVEAAYFKLKDLELEICASTVVVSIASALNGGGSNPFDDAGRYVKKARNFFLVGGSAFTSAHVGGLTPGSWQEFLEIAPQIKTVAAILALV